MLQRELPTRRIRLTILASCLALYGDNLFNVQADDAAAPAVEGAATSRFGGISPAIYYVVSSDRTSIAAFSGHTGLWQSQTIELVEQTEPVPLVGGDFVIFTAGTAMHAFNARTGNWCSAELPDGERNGPIVSAELAVMQVGRTLFAFSANHDVIHTIEVETDERVDISVYPEMAIGRVGDRWYGYGGRAGKWDTIDVPAPQ